MDNRPLEAQRQEFSSRLLIAMPCAGLTAWTVAGVGGYLLPERQAALLMFVATGLIVYLAMFISRFTGERFPDKSKPLNRFDALFLCTVGMGLLCYAIAIPFYLIDRSSLPLSIGILTGLMWVTISWIIQHWIGIAHAAARTVAVLVAWYLLPHYRFVAVPAVIAVLYAVAIIILINRQRPSAASDSQLSASRARIHLQDEIRN